MRQRFMVKDGILVDRDGNELGRLVSLTLDVREGGGLKGGVGSENNNTLPKEEPHTKDGGVGETIVRDVDAVWAHYVGVMEPRKKELDPAGRALVRDALKVATAVECCRAIDGCQASDFHMGQNDRGRKYNRLSQILKGKRGIRTTREQIDLFLDIAEKAGVGTAVTSVDPARLTIAKRNVLAAWEMPHSEQAKRAGEMSAAWLAQHGYRIEHDAQDGRPSFLREDV